MISLKKASILLLHKCLKNHRPDLLWIIESNDRITINQDLGNELREAVSDELIIYGFDKEVPNEYGVELESLIDEIGRIFLP